MRLPVQVEEDAPPHDLLGLLKVEVVVVVDGLGGGVALRGLVYGAVGVQLDPGENCGLNFRDRWEMRTVLFTSSSWKRPCAESLPEAPVTCKRISTFK